MRIHQFSVDLALVSHEMFELAKVMLQSLQAGGYVAFRFGDGMA